MWIKNRLGAFTIWTLFTWKIAGMLLMIKNVADTRFDFDVAKINYIWNHEHLRFTYKRTSQFSQEDFTDSQQLF